MSDPQLRDTDYVAFRDMGTLDVIEWTRTILSQREPLASPAQPGTEAALRATIERDARLGDALDALRTAVLWQGGHVGKPGESWYRKARSGVVGLEAALTPAEPTLDVEPTIEYQRGWNDGFRVGKAEARLATIPEGAPDPDADAATIAEHDATHEAEMCGADCIRLGLAVFPEGAPDA